MDQVLVRMTWKDPLTSIVHAVDIDLSAFPQAHEIAEEVRQGRIRWFSVVGSRGETVCGRPMPPRAHLHRDDEVTCNDCLSSDAGPAIEMARLILADARKPVAA